MQIQRQHAMCYRRGNRSPQRKTSSLPSKRSIIHQKMQLGYMNSNRPSKLLTEVAPNLFLFQLTRFRYNPYHLPSLASSNASQSSKNTQHSKWVWVVFGQKFPLNRYYNERGNKKRLQRFLSNNEQLSLIEWVF